MLRLSHDERVFLIGLGVLTTDADGNEVLAGLSAEQSHFLVDFSSSPTAAELAQRWIYHQTLGMHIAARLDAINKQTGCPALPDGGTADVFGEGDVVRLKCGGPEIDVIGTIDVYPFQDGPAPGVFCVWEDRHERHEQVYPICAIEPVAAAPHRA
jgi:uncharacterized protein YodC (DUF2158 family)